MASIVGELVVVLWLILANGLFSMAELAVVSARRARLLDWAERGDAGAKVALELQADPNRLLSTVQIGITLVGTIAGVFGGATLAARLSALIARVDALARYADPLAMVLVVAIITFVTLVVGELVPKRVAMAHPERIARRVSRPLRAIAAVGVPLVAVLSRATELVLRGLGIGPASESPVTPDEVTSLVDLGAKSGVFEPVEQTMVKRVLRLGDRRASQIMTPRNEVVWIDLTDPPEEIRRKVTESPHSRFPVCEETLDNILGVVEAKDLLAHGLTRQPLQVKGFLRVPLFIYEGTPGLRVLEMFRNSGTHVAVVIDEYGTVEGLLTPNDLLAAIVGDLPAPDDADDPRVVRREDGSFSLDGRLGTDELKELFSGLTLPEGDYHTLAGLVLARLGRIPRVADTFTWDGLAFEVADMDGNRVDRVIVTRPGATPAG